MRNLKVRSAILSDTWLSSGEHAQQQTCSTLPSASEVEAVCVDAENRIFCACNAGIYELSAKSPELIDWRQQRSDAKIVTFDHLSDEYLLCAVLSSGVVLLVDYEGRNIEQCDVVPAEICAASWAPDYHVLLLASREMLYFITRQFDILSEQPLSSAKSGREELLTVGWGSKETQFQGAAARRQPKKDGTEQPTVVTECDQRRVLLAWNGDANYVAVSYVENETSHRRFCVFDHEGELISRLEQTSNVEEALAYRPSGNLIATSRVRGDNRDIIFYERNGQRRSEFELRLSSGKMVVWLSWNTDGTILCVRLKNLEGTEQEVQFWYVSNYNWMLKYRIVVHSGFLLACWHESNPNQFCYVTCTGRAAFVDFDFAYDFYDGTVLSITGCSVRVTNLKAAPVPPPMCHYELAFPNTVSEVVQYNGCAAFLLADLSLHAYKLSDGRFEKCGEYDTTSLPEDCICYNLRPSDAGSLSAVVASSVYALYSLSLKSTNSEKSICLYSAEKPFIWHCSIRNGFLLQRVDGEWFSIAKDKGKGNNYVEARRHFTTTGGLHYCHCLKDSIFGIGKGNDLVVNGRSIFRYVGSYAIDPNYLLAITFASQSPLSKLQIVKLEDVLTVDNEVSCKDNRAVEKGAMLIGHEAGGTRVWLQMPRGNLETIHLRELLLSKIKELLNTSCFRESALMMKKHRIDMNLFYDHNPEFFMKHIGKFVEDISSAELLNLFVASLNNDDVTRGMYSASYSNDHNVQAKKNGKVKIQTVCSALRDHILSLDDTHVTELYTAVISTYLKEHPPQIATALSALRERSSKLPDGVELEEKWIAYVSLLAPNENLFKVALSTYDLSLAHAVARNSQMDPKEYLPVLADFQAQSPPAYQKSKIDVYLGLFERAVRNLSELDDHWDEAAAIIRRQNLYPEALIAYRGKRTYLKTCELCANHLMSKRRFEEAALLFRRAQNMEQALQCYESAHNWKKVVECGQVMGLEREALNDKLKKMMPHFENNGKFCDIAEILSFIDEKTNEEQILECFCKADAWNCAVNFATRSERGIECLYEKAHARCEQILQNVENWESLLGQYSSRLEVVRQNKKETLSAAIERCVDHDASMSEVFSETSTAMSDISKISAASTASSRRRKHIEKKKKVLKEGSQYEDAALLNAIKDVVSLIDTRQDELLVLLPALVTVDAVEEARNLQSQFSALIKYAHKIIAAAWPSYLSANMIPGPLLEIYRGEDGVIRLPEENSMPARIPFDSELIPPKIRNIIWHLEICS